MCVEMLGMEQNISTKVQIKNDSQPSTLIVPENLLETTTVSIEPIPPTSIKAQPFTPKRIVAIAGNRGGTGKTTTAVTFYEWYLVNGIKIFAYDYESDNKESSCFAHFVKNATRHPLHYEREALDQMLMELETKNESIILADFGAGSQRETIQFFQDYYEMLIEHNVRLTLVGVLDSDIGALKGMLEWSDHMSPFTKLDWMIVLNEKDVIGEKFDYWHRSPDAEAFRKLCKPAVITLRSRNPKLQNALRNDGLTLQDVIHRKFRPGHPLDNFTQESLARKYWKDIERQLYAVAATHLLPVTE